MRTLDDVLNADFRTEPTLEEVETWRQERLDLEAQLAEAQRREGLLLDFALAAQLYINKSVGDPDVYPDTYATWLDYLAKMQAAIDGGAMESGEQ